MRRRFSLSCLEMAIWWAVEVLRAVALGLTRVVVDEIFGKSLMSAAFLCVIQSMWRIREAKLSGNE